MAEGGEEIEMNDLFRQDEYDDNEVETSFRDDYEFNQYLSNYINKYFEQLENLLPKDKKTHENKIIKIMVKRFYDYNNKSYLNKDSIDFF